MRKTLKTTGAVILALVLILSSAAFVSAKDLEVCYHCSGTGRFECPNCHNQVWVTCDGCGGTGGTKCDGEEGKGPCDNGYYTCPSCHGDGYARSGDGTVAPDTPPNSCRYGTCNGTGKIECWKCHGKAWNDCTRCNGQGKVECQNGNCIESRKVDWKCHYCMGAGYLLTNFWPGENDGVQNKPVAGDKIWANGKSTTYGGGSGSDQGNNDQGGNSGGNNNQGGNSGGNNNQGGGSGNSGSTTPRYDSNGANINRDPSNGRDFVWFINVGSGEWDFNGHKVTVQRNGKAASGTLDVHYSDRITIINHDNVPNLAIYITGANDFKARLIASGDGGVSIEDRDPAGSYVPFNVNLVLEADENWMGDTFKVDFGSGSWNVRGKEAYATINGQRAQGVMDYKAGERIALHGLDRDTMTIRLRGEGGFSVELDDISGDDEVSFGHEEGGFVIPPNVSFVIEDSGWNSPDGGPRSVDFGGGNWNVGGKDIYATINGVRAEGTIDVDPAAPIKLYNFDSSKMSVRIYSDDGFSLNLIVNGDDEVTLMAFEGDFALPPFLHFAIEGEDHAIYEVDFGSGSWNIERSDVLVNALIDGQPVSGRVEIDGSVKIKLEGFDGGYMQARVYADDGFSVILNHTGDNEVFLDSYLGDADGLPGKLHFVIESTRKENKTYTIAIKGCYTAQSSIDWRELRSISNNLEIRVQMIDAAAEVLFEIPNNHGSIRIYNIMENSEMQLLGTFKDPQYYNPKYLSVFVQDSNGNVAELIPDANNVVCLARRVPADVELSEQIALYFTPAPGYESEIRRFTDAPFYIYDYYRDMSVETSGDINKISGFDIVTDRMEPDEASAFSKYSEEELESLGAIIESIVSTGRPAEITNALKMKLNKVAKENGVDANRKGQFFPIQFDGHVDLPFPVKVTVHLEPGVLDGSRPIYMYHITDKGVVEYLDIAEVTLREDGSVEALSFYTKSFSDFFGSEVQLTEGLGVEDPEYAAQFEWNQVSNNKPDTLLIIGVAAAVVVIAAAAVVLVKKKKQAAA